MGRTSIDKLDARGDLKRLTKAARGEADPERREAARACLERRLPALVDGLASRDVRVVRRCRAALAAVGEPAVARLADVVERGPDDRRDPDLARDSDTRPRQSSGPSAGCKDAVFALGEIGLPSAVRPLERAIRDSDAFVRLLAVEALLKVNGADDEVRPLIAAARTDDDEAVALAARRGLHKLGPRSAPVASAGRDERAEGDERSVS